MAGRVNSEVVSVSAPNRIDFAGGTLDVFPIFLLEEEAVTINAAITIYSQATIRRRKDRRVLLFSRDQKKRELYASVEHLPKRGPLHLLAEAVRFFHPSFGVEVITDNEAPRGSGLGASSALLVAVMRGLGELTGKKLQRTTLMHDASLVEAKVIGIPTGKQDYGAALFGGFKAFIWTCSGYAIQSFAISPQFRKKIESHSLLVFSGVSHFSARSNWEILKRYIERDRRTRRAIQGIRQSAHAMVQALHQADILAVADALDREWFHRKQLALEVSADSIERMERELRGHGLLGIKACGAGGGGCLYLLVEPEVKDEAAEVVARLGGRVLPFSFLGRGLVVSSS